MCLCFLDQQPAFGSSRQVLCMCMCVCVFPWPATCIRVSRQGLCMCVCVSLTGDLVFRSYRQGVCFSQGRVCMFVYTCMCFPDQRPVLVTSCACIIFYPHLQKGTDLKRVFVESSREYVI